jgi:hypothetical protein
MKRLDVMPPLCNLNGLNSAERLATRYRKTPARLQTAVDSGAARSTIE